MGNNLNDMDMIKEFKSYVMENSDGEIKKFAHHITPSVTNLIEKRDLGCYKTRSFNMYTKHKWETDKYP